jgi:hypothetical protein
VRLPYNCLDCQAASQFRTVQRIAIAIVGQAHRLPCRPWRGVTRALAISSVSSANRLLPENADYNFVTKKLQIILDKFAVSD